jgi:hypothetical protein
MTDQSKEPPERKNPSQATLSHIRKESTFEHVISDSDAIRARGLGIRLR